VADAQLAQIVVDRHPRLGAELLAQRALAALLLLAEFFQHETLVQTARKPGDELIQQRFLRGSKGIIRSVTMPLQGHHQLGKKQLRHLVCHRIALLALLLQLGNRLAHLSHAVAA